MSDTDTQTLQRDQAESYIRFWGSRVSIRAIITLMLVATLCALAANSPESFVEPFKYVTLSAISFYYGQKSPRT